jgi:hypothetical protein
VVVPLHTVLEQRPGQFDSLAGDPFWVAMIEEHAFRVAVTDVTEKINVRHESKGIPRLEVNKRERARKALGERNDNIDPGIHDAETSPDCSYNAFPPLMQTSQIRIVEGVSVLQQTARFEVLQDGGEVHRKARERELSRTRRNC